MFSRNTLRNLVSRALASAFRRTDRRLKPRNSRTEQLETRALLAVFTVSSTADAGAGSLRQAILDANGAAGADQIVFAPSTNGTEFDLGGTQFTITESLTITGNGADNTVIDAQMTSRIFEITDSAVNVTIAGVRLKNGRVEGAGLQVGGAIRSLATGTLSISSSVLSGNTADDTSGTSAYGGAVFVQGGSLTVFGSTISGNTADWGGAIYANGDSDVSITSSNVDGNFASNDGGAIYAGFGGQGDVTITGSTLENNVSEKRGGAIRADNVTITGGSSVLLNSSTAEGGAIHADGNVTVTNSTISENTATTEGGAIHAGGNVVVTGSSTMSDNAATGKGGAIFSVGSTEVTNSTISGNSTSGNFGNGGAIFANTGAVTISHSTLSGNTTAGDQAYGGAVYTNGGAVTISQSTLSGNSTTGSTASGGAIFANTGAVTISQSTLSGNSTAGNQSQGGAVYTISGAVTVSQSTLSGNSTAGNLAFGGAISSSSGAVSISQSTLTLNNAAQSLGGAIFSLQSPVSIRNSIIAANTDNGTVPDVRKSPDGDVDFTVANSLIGRNNGTGLTASATPDINGNLVGGDNAGAAINPQLSPLANNGGPTQTHALLSTSPAINQGSNPLAAGLTTDQRGNPFVRIATTVDMGAYERQTVAGLSLIVDTNQDENDGNYSAGDLSLREAIGLANGSIGTNTITFAPSLFTGGPASIVLRLGELGITESVTINGPGQTQLSINANQLSRVLNVIGGGQINVTLSGLTLTGGRTTASNASSNTHSGGGIRFDSTGTLTLTNSTLSGNSTTGNSAQGGGIYASSGAVTLTNSTVSGNSTEGDFADGGGIFASSGAVTLTNSTVSGNSTAGDFADGGGIFASTGAVTLTNSTVSGNTTAGTDSDGGGIYASIGVVTLTNSTVSGNTTAGTDSDGGGIYASTGAVTLTNSTVSGNQVTGTNSEGGGVRFDDSVVIIVNSTITDNSAAGAGGGLGMLVDGTDKKLTIRNSIIAGNTAGSNPDFTAPTTPATNLEVRHSLIGRSDGTTLTASANPNSNGNLIGGSTPAAAINPLLAPLANNGGPTQTRALLTNSPAINRGSNALAAGLTTDQRGNPFARILQTTVDMGAFERATLLGTANADAFVLNYSSLTTSGTVTVTISTNGGPATSLGTFPMNAALTIDGLGGTDSVRVIGTTGADTIIVNSSTGLVVNGASLILQGIENRTLAGGAGGDVYRFDADTALGLWSLEESGVETDTIDFTPTSAAVSAFLGTAATQVINGNLSLKLNSTTAFENATGGSGDDTLVGSTGANVLTGNGGKDKFFGGLGSDTLVGGTGDDTYNFSPATGALEADSVTEVANGGTDTLSFSSITTNVFVNMTLTTVQNVHANRTLKLNLGTTLENAAGGSGNDTLGGNTLSNTLTGNGGNDAFYGGLGSDVLIGGLGDDTYHFSPATGTPEADSVTEATNAGIDTLSFSSITTNVVVNLTLATTQAVHTNRTLKLNSGSSLENANGGSGNDALGGNSLANVLTGNGGNDAFYPGLGSDALIGGPGDDTYHFSTATAGLEAETVTELSGGGTDTLNFGGITTNVIASLALTTVQNVHANRSLKLNLNNSVESVLGGSGNDTLTGNTLDNVLVGNAGTDTLVGGDGRDILIGGLGLDTINGGVGDDILIGGRTTSDSSVANLNTLRTHWISSNSYAAGVASLRAGVGSPVVSLKAKVNVLNDAGEDDSLTGGTDTDWYFRALDDAITDLFAGELVDVL